MSDNKNNGALGIINPKEGELVGTIRWPFYRYKLTMPKAIEDDVFEWLYVSIVVLKSHEVGNIEKKEGDEKEVSYNDEVKVKAKNKMSELFLDKLFDKTTMDKIIRSVESKYLNESRTKLSKKATENTNPYQVLFSDSMEVKSFFQDAITGSIHPAFYDDTELEELGIVDQFKGDGDLINPEKVRQPSKPLIRRAYEKYIQLGKYSFKDDIESLVEEDDEFKEDELDVVDKADEKPEPFKKSRAKEIDLGQYNVFFAEKRVLIYREVPVEILDNKLHLLNPFKNTTDWWMNDCFNKSRETNSQLKRIYTDLEKHLVCNHSTEKLKEFSKNKITDQLVCCKSIYEAIDRWGDEDLRELIIIIDQYYSRRLYTFYYGVGQLIDDMINMVDNPNRTSAQDRESVVGDYDLFRERIRRKLNGTNIDYRRFMSNGVIRNWTLARDNEDTHNFKSYLADLFLTTNISKSVYVSPDFIDRTFELYDHRNGTDHSYKRSKKMKIVKRDIDTLEQIVNLLTAFKFGEIRWENTEEKSKM